jgi:hypothetical protein
MTFEFVLINERVAKRPRGNLCAFGYYTVFIIDFSGKVILGFVSKLGKFSLKKLLIALACLALISVLPSSFATDVIDTLTGAVAAPVVDTPPAEPAPAAPTDAPSPSAAPVPSDSPAPVASPAAAVAPTSSATPTPSPTPTPPHAIANQNMTIMVPGVLAVDPRAHTVFLPQIYVANAGNLLVCASSSYGSFDAHVMDMSGTKGTPSSLEISGSFTPYLRISGLGTQAAYLINSGPGMRVFSNARSLAGSYVQLRFVALSEVSSDPKLCNDGSPSNTRTIHLRGLDLDLNMVKGDVTLK